MKGTTHSEIKVFYKELHSSMGIVRMEEVEDNNGCIKPHLRGVCEKSFIGVKKSYWASQYQKEVITLTNIMMPEMLTVLAC